MQQRKVISLWSGPRNVSTALMYSFGERDDMEIVDEPLYGYYLQKTDADHPGKEEVLATMEKDPREIWSGIAASGSNTFVKNMAHHALDLNEEWYDVPLPVLLIRDPREMLPSLTIQLPGATLRDTGLKRQAELLLDLRKRGKKAIVIDSARLLTNPEDILRKVCGELGIPFDSSMLSWTAGPRKEDGIWARHWYHGVHESTGFQPYKKKTAAFPDKLLPLLEECDEYYQILIKQAIS